MLEVRNLTKWYPTRQGRKYVLRDLNLSVPDGKGIGVMGRNGAGKSTLLRLLGGIEAPSRGEVVCDKSISWPVGLTGGFQGQLSARDNLRFICRVFGATGELMNQRIRWVEEFAEIGDWFDLPVRQYSPGMRTRVTFGASMVFDFDYYLVDEVLAVGDASFRAKAHATFRQKLTRSTALLVSHNPKDIRDLCSQVVVVDGGNAKVYEDVEEGIEVYLGLMKPTSNKEKTK